MEYQDEVASNQRIWRIADARAQKQGMRSTIFFAGGVKYAGEWNENLREGNGTQEYADGSRYDGNWLKGQRHGHGLFFVPIKGTELLARQQDGTQPQASETMRLVYSGEWANDMHEGYGTYYYENGEQYEGDWLRNKRHGFGTMYYQDGTRYVGHWVNDVRVGQGTLYKADGNRYEGAWDNDQPHGTGVFYYPAKHRKYVGEWVQGTAKCGIYENFACAPNPPPGLLVGGEAAPSAPAQPSASDRAGGLPPDTIRKAAPAVLPALQLQSPEQVVRQAVTDAHHYAVVLAERQQREREVREEEERRKREAQEMAEAEERAQLSQQAKALSSQRV